MVNRELGKKIREEILNALPICMVPGDEDERWIAAVINAEDYYRMKFQGESKIPVQDNSLLVDLFSRGKTATYISYACGTTFMDAVTRLRNEGIPVPKYPYFTLEDLHTMDSPDSALPEEVKTEVNSISQNMRVSIPLSAVVFEDEMNISGDDTAIIRAMLEDGYSISDVARHAGVNIGAAIDKFSGKYVHNTADAVRVADAWDRGLSVNFIAILENADMMEVIKVLHSLNYATVDGGGDYSLHEINSHTGHKLIPGEFTKVAPKNKKVSHGAPTNDELIEVINKLAQGNSDTEVARALSRMIGAPVSITEKLVARYRR